MESTTKVLTKKLRKCVELCDHNFAQVIVNGPDRALSGTTFNLLVRATDELSALLPQLVEVLRSLVRQGIGTAAQSQPIRREVAA